MQTDNVEPGSAKKTTFISLFSGCGGLDLGILQAGLVPVAAYDIWPVAIENYRRNLGNHAHIHDLSSGSIPFDGHCDVVIAGSPCQGFSTVGKRRVDDPRNHLLHSAVQIAIKVRPRVMVFENVPGILQGAHKVHWNLACSMIDNAGYNFRGITIDARSIGIPQSRKRVILFGWRKEYNLSTQFEPQNPLKLMDVISDVGEIENHEPKLLSPESPEYKISSKILPGQKLCNVRGASTSVHTWQVPEVFGETSLEEREVLEVIMKIRRRIRVRDYGDADPVELASIDHALGRSASSAIENLIAKGYIKNVGSKLDLKNTFNGKYRRASPSGASFTVDSRFGDPRCFLHPIEHRGFSVREAARIQGFPDDYVFQGTIEDQFRLVANAVPPKMGFTLGNMILSAFEDVVKP